MTSKTADVFSELRATLQQKKLSWATFIATLDAQMLGLKEKERQIVRESYTPYLEQEVARRFADHERTISLRDTLQDIEPLARTLARHLEVRYDFKLMTKAYLTRCKQRWLTHPIDHITTLSFVELGARNAVALIDMLYRHGPTHISHMSFSLTHELARAKPALTQKTLAVLLDVPEPTTLRTLIWAQYFTVVATLQAHVWDTLTCTLPHLTSLNALVLAEDSHHPERAVALLDVLPDSLQRLSLNLEHMPTTSSRFFERLGAPSTASDTAHTLNKVLNHPRIRTLQGLRIAGLKKDAIAYTNTHPSIQVIPHVVLSWVARQHLFTGWNGASELHHQLTRDDVNLTQYHLVEELELGALEPITFDMLRALLLDDSGQPHVFPFLKGLKTVHVDVNTLSLLLKHGPTCFPMLSSLNVLTVAEEDVATHMFDWAKAPSWPALRELRVYAKSEVAREMVTSLWKHPSRFPLVHVLGIYRLSLDGYVQAFTHLSQSFPELRELRLTLTDDEMSVRVFEALKGSEVLPNLTHLDFYLQKRLGSRGTPEHVKFWIHQVHDDTLPIQLRRFIVHKMMQDMRKMDILDHIGPVMDIRFPKSYSLMKLTERFLASLPEEARDHDQAEFKPHDITQSPISLAHPPVDGNA